LESEYFKLWLTVVISISSVVILPLWIINIRCYYNDLKQQKAPQPFLITIKQLGIVQCLLLPLYLLPINLSSLNTLKGRRVWLSWDIRWFRHDSTLAIIEEVLKHPKGHTLLIRLDRPMKFSSDSIIVERVLFKPSSHLTNVMRYCSGAVSGGLLPFEDIPELNDLISHGSLASCGIVVY